MSIQECVKQTTAEEINAAMKQAAETPLDKGALKTILSYSTDPLVSSDIIDDPHSSIFVAELSLFPRAENNTFSKITLAGLTHRLCQVDKAG